LKTSRVYLAGPEVFLPNAKDVGDQKKALCGKFGFEGVFPIDTEVYAKGKTPREVGMLISEVNEGLIKNCDVVVANITPFRGPSADVGTVYEMGVAHAQGKLVLAYTNVASGFTERTVQALGGQVLRDRDGKLWDAEGMQIEDFGLTDNLMVDGCLNANSKVLVVEQAPEGQLFSFLGGFEKCLRAAQEILMRQQKE
jgi:nucleoside 2-deoxyribosyltransferase